MKAPLVQHRLLAALLMAGLVATTGISFDAHAQLAGKRSDARRNKQAATETQTKREADFPAATRVEPEHKASPRLSKKMSRMIDGFNEAKFDVALASAEEILADDKLKKIFGGKDKVSMFEMNKHLSNHLSQP